MKPTSPRQAIVLLGLALLLLLQFACTSRRTRWEYKVVPITAASSSLTGSAALKGTTLTPSEEHLQALGKEGWELATSYLEMETVWPNFGNDKYVTGLQPNVRPQRLVLVFKRPVG